jgi:LmbE family N-acetylglucosaminyl deacetylase
MNILAVFAHPDDEVLAAGATLSRYAREGHRVTIAILGEGITSRYASREAALADPNARDDLMRLQGMRSRAALALGQAHMVYSRGFDLPDNRFDTVSLLSVIKIVEALAESEMPSVVLTHHPGDLNVDHGIVTEAVLTAFRSLPERRACQILAGEVLSSTDYSAGVPGRAFEPNLWVPVLAEDVDRKITALEEYRDEVRAFPHPRSPEAVESLARWRGAQAGVPFAEAFRLLRGWGTLPGTAGGEA